MRKEAVEDTARVQIPSPMLPPSQEAEGCNSCNQTPNPTQTVEPEQEKQQLASSLFVGLASNSSVSLVGFLFFICTEMKLHNNVKTAV